MLPAPQIADTFADVYTFRYDFLIFYNYYYFFMYGSYKNR